MEQDRWNEIMDSLRQGTDPSQMAADDLNWVINVLREASLQAWQREIDAKRKKEKAEAQRKLREEQERQEAHIQEVTSMDLPMDWENLFGTDTRAQGIHTDSIPDGLILCLSNLGRVDIEYIAAITGADYKDVISALQGSIYQNPDTWDECFYKGWETADEYLSGNLMRKWRTAKAANDTYHGYFSRNLEAIEAVLPPVVAAEEIYITLGSPWVPSDIIDEFIIRLFGEPYRYKEYDEALEREALATVHDTITGTWEIPDKARYGHDVAMCRTYGTERMEALHILEKTLNMKTLAVTDEIVSHSALKGTKRVINQSETVAALEKQKKLISAFQKWVWADEGRKKRLEGIYEEKYGCIRQRHFDGSFLTFPGMSPEVHLYPYQKNAAARIIFSPNTLLAHDVGSGKTYVMIAAGQELRRMGISQKNLYVVPNNIVGQWEHIFRTMYPDAKLLIVEPKTFSPQKRNRILQQIRDESFDGIVMAYSCFEQIQLSRDYVISEMKELRDTISETLKDRNRSTSRLRNKRDALEKAMAQALSAVGQQDDTVYFDELGITRLFVDEAHNFKNVPFETKVNSVLGISAAGSRKCRDMLDKVHMIQRSNGGGGVVMATGTPITNSVTDVFVMQQYLQSGELAMLDLQSFDSWIGMFAEKVTEFEVDVDTSSYRLATRFARFHNLPELANLLSPIADFHTADGAGIPEFHGYTDALISRTAEFEEYLRDISQRADAVRSGMVDRRTDNMLKITTDGRKAALDLRLASPYAAFTYQCKAARCAEITADLYWKTAKEKGAQLIFCDSSTPKSGFNIYSELKRLLAGLGLPPEQIAFIHDAETEASRTKLFAKVRAGEIRVLIGSTFKLGLGVNVQDRLCALHHLDIPWRPADMTQREGRILRQGNQNQEVAIYRYITEGSFDAYSWQLLETKQRFITDLLSGSLAERSGTDIGGTALDYAEVKALAVGDPLVKKRVETANELTRLLTLQKNLVEAKLNMEQELLELPAKIQMQEDNIAACQEDLAFVQDTLENVLGAGTRSKQEDEQRKALREAISLGLRSHILEPKEREILTYRGFRLMLPANMSKEKPCLWLLRKGRYYVELGDTEVGNLIRIDHFLDNMSNHLRKLLEAKVQLSRRKEDLRRELEKPEDYADKIQDMKKKLESLDRKLGVGLT